MWLLKIEQHIHFGVLRIELQESSDFFVMDRKADKGRFNPSVDEVVVNAFIEDRAGRNGPGFLQAALAFDRRGR